MYRKILINLSCVMKSHKCNTWFSSEIVHVLKAVAIVASEHFNLSTNFAINQLLCADFSEMSLEWRLKPGFGTQKMCSFLLNIDIPSIEITNKKVLYVNIFLGLPLNFPCNTGVSLGSVHCN